MPSDLRMAVFAAARHAALAAASIVLVVSFMIVGTAGGAANRERDAQAPSAPAHIGVVSVTATMVGIGWEASTDNVGVVGYYVYVMAIAAESKAPATTPIGSNVEAV